MIRTSAAPILDAAVALAAIGSILCLVMLLLAGFVYARRRLSIRTGPRPSD